MENQICYLEIRGATGGDEAKLWGADLLRMYTRYGLKKAWKVIPMDEKTIRISGPGVSEAPKKEIKTIIGRFFQVRPFPLDSR